MSMKIDLDYLKTSLPLLEKELKEKYARLTSIFKEIISAKTENEAFFKSPLNYLESQQALPSVEIAKGQKLPLLQEKALVHTIRKARDLYKAGKLELKTIIAPKAEVTYKVESEFISRHITPDTITSKTKNESTFKNFPVLGASSLAIDDHLIGPLADPTIFEKLHASIEAELKKAKE